MRIPIQYALTWPQRIAGPAPRLDLLDHPRMDFSAPDVTRFPALAIARAAGHQGPRATTALISADEVAVERFLEGSLSFTGVARLAAGAIERFGDGPDPDVDDLIDLDAGVRAWARTADTDGRVARA